MTPLRDIYSFLFAEEGSEKAQESKKKQEERVDYMLGTDEY